MSRTASVKATLGPSSKVRATWGTLRGPWSVSAPNQPTVAELAPIHRVTDKVTRTLITAMMRTAVRRGRGSAGTAVGPRRPVTALGPRRPLTAFGPRRPEPAVTALGPRRPVTAVGPRRPVTAFGPRRPVTAFGPRRPVSAVTAEAQTKAAATVRARSW